MKFTKRHYIQVLEEAFDKIRERNSAYSLRAFSRDLGVNPGVLNQVIRDKRNLSQNQAEKICEKLDLSQDERRRFIDSCFERSQLFNDFDYKEESYVELSEEEHVTLIVEWEYYALFYFLKLCQTEINWKDLASKRLGFSLEKTEKILSLLIKSGLVEIENGFPQCIDKDLKTSDGVLSQALQMAHIKTLELAQRRIQQTPVNLRDYTSMTLPVNVKKLDKVRVLIREFYFKLSKIVEDGNENDIYNLSVQLFPLTLQEQK